MARPVSWVTTMNHNARTKQRNVQYSKFCLAIRYSINFFRCTVLHFHFSLKMLEPQSKEFLRNIKNQPWPIQELNDPVLK